MTNEKEDSIGGSNNLHLRPKDGCVDVSIKGGPSPSELGGAAVSSTLEMQTRTRRLFSFPQLFAFSLSYMSIWAGTILSLWYGLYNGGPRTLLISYTIAFLGALGQSASFAEMSSMQPIAGAQYHWTWKLSTGPPRRIATWIQGWTTWFAYVSIIAGVTSTSIMLLEAIISINHPDWVSSGWKTAVLSIALSIFQGLLNTHAFRFIPWIELLAGMLNVLLVVIFLVVLAVMGPRNPGSFIVSTNYSSGWTNHFIASNAGTLGAIWCYTGHEGVIHMGEESKNPRVDVPRAAFWSLFTNGCIALIMLMVAIIAMGDLEDLLEVSLPIQEILLQATKSKAATTAMLCGLFINSVNVNLAAIASTSRLTWAWARDGGLPSYFAYVAPKRRVPVQAVVLVVTIVCLLCLLNINSAALVAYGAIAALSSMACYTSYAIAIGSMLHARWNARGAGMKLGPWNLGRYGVWINIWALAYTSWAIVFLPFPTSVPVTGANMNYSGPLMGAILLVALTTWMRARKTWQGPNADVIDIVLAKAGHD